jgi:hypothetical protein
MRSLLARTLAFSNVGPPGRFPGRVLLVALSLGPLCGCGRLTSPGYSVSGEVQWKGQPLDQGSIQFVPEDSHGTMVGSGISNGHYTLPNPPGLPAGKYRVRINSLSGASTSPGSIPDMHLGNPESTERIPADYNEKTTLEVEVTSGGSRTFDFDLTDKAGPAAAARPGATR